ncbi:ankyrin repeat-containing domain protein [Pisolithus tinctorius]|nr:ankyrin repeat-containing domain protein [Pisolithus tinctorius]
MAEKDASSKLRKAVKENNLFLVKRLIQRTDMRNPDSTLKRYTSLTWAAVLGHEEIFEFLLTAGHDDEELSRDLENNTILMLLADFKPPTPNPYAPGPSQADLMSAALRMARLYYDRYPWILDWSNSQGKTALHMAALKGNEELVRMLCDWGADFDLSDNKGNTPLHYASAWGHIPIVQLLIERGCQFAARNNDGFTPSDYAYSFSTRDTLQDSARTQFEANRKTRRLVYAQAAARGHEWGVTAAGFERPPPVPIKDYDAGMTGVRMRSGSGATTTTDSGDIDSAGVGAIGTSLSSLSSSASQQLWPRPAPVINSSSQRPENVSSASSGGGTFSVPSPGPSQSMLLNPHTPTHKSSLSPIVDRLRERDADEMEKYKRRNRSGSGETSSTDNARSQVVPSANFTSAGPSSNGDDITALSSLGITGSTAPRKRLRPSWSAAQLRSSPSSAPTPSQAAQADASRNRAGTSPGSSRFGQPLLTPGAILTRTASSDTPRHEEKAVEEPENLNGPSLQLAHLREPPRKPGIRSASSSTAAAIGRRLPFNLLSKPAHPPPEPPHGHRRGTSIASIRS